ncbi:hypothetical protein Godav_019684, partial [Gossypium davidsonii]|nr:hypothetical protein [Gossypium davidsonii]
MRLDAKAVNNTNWVFKTDARKWSKEAITFGHVLGFRSIVVEGDSLTVTKKLHNVNPDKSVLGSIIQDIKRKVKGFDYITFAYVGRLANNATHTLARCEFWPSKPRFWIEEAPTEVELVANQDGQKWVSRSAE